MMSLRELTRTTVETAAIQTGPVEEICIFTLRFGHEWIGLPISAVHTVFRIGKITPVPLGPPEVVGLVNLRGRITTALILHGRFDQPAPARIEDALAIGIDYDGSHFAVIVDDVGDVLRIPKAARIDVPFSHLQQTDALQADYFKIEDRLLAVVDLASLVTTGPALRPDAA